jgi:hypothetical protein
MVGQALSFPIKEKEEERVSSFYAITLSPKLKFVFLFSALLKKTRSCCY